MTVEIANEDVWKAIESGEITGLSMGGIGRFAEQETDLEKQEAPEEIPDKLSLLEKVARAFGLESAVVKGELRDKYEHRARAGAFWEALEALRNTLTRYNYYDDQVEFEADEEKIREALEDFNNIIVDLLQAGNVAEALASSKPEEIEKAGRKMSKANKEKLNNIAQQLIDFVKEFDDEEEPRPEPDEAPNDETAEREDEVDMNREDVQKMIDEAIEKALQPKEEPVEEPVEKAEEQPENLTQEQVQEMIAEAVQKAEQPAAPSVDTESIQKMIDEAIAKAFKQRGLSTSMDDGTEKAVEKEASQHYLHGLL